MNIRFLFILVIFVSLLLPSIAIDPSRGATGDQLLQSAQKLPKSISASGVLIDPKVVLTYGDLKDIQSVHVGKKKYKVVANLGAGISPGIRLLVLNQKVAGSRFAPITPFAFSREYFPSSETIRQDRSKYGTLDKYLEKYYAPFQHGSDIYIVGRPSGVTLNRDHNILDFNIPRVLGTQKIPSSFFPFRTLTQSARVEKSILEHSVNILPNGQDSNFIYTEQDHGSFVFVRDQGEYLLVGVTIPESDNASKDPLVKELKDVYGKVIFYYDLESLRVWLNLQIGSLDRAEGQKEKERHDQAIKEKEKLYAQQQEREEKEFMQQILNKNLPMFVGSWGAAIGDRWILTHQNNQPKKVIINKKTYNIEKIYSCPIQNKPLQLLELDRSISEFSYAIRLREFSTSASFDNLSLLYPKSVYVSVTGRTDSKDSMEFSARDSSFSSEERTRGVLNSFDEIKRIAPGFPGRPLFLSLLKNPDLSQDFRLFAIQNNDPASPMILLDRQVNAWIDHIITLRVLDGLYDSASFKPALPVPQGSSIKPSLPSISRSRALPSIPEAGKGTTSAAKFPSTPRSRSLPSTSAEKGALISGHPAQKPTSQIFPHTAAQGQSSSIPTARSNAPSKIKLPHYRLLVYVNGSPKTAERDAIQFVNEMILGTSDPRLTCYLQYKKPAAEGYSGNFPASQHLKIEGHLSVAREDGTIDLFRRTVSSPDQRDINYGDIHEFNQFLSRSLDKRGDDRVGLVIISTEKSDGWYSLVEDRSKRFGILDLAPLVSKFKIDDICLLTNFSASLENMEELYGLTESVFGVQGTISSNIALESVSKAVKGLSTSLHAQTDDRLMPHFSDVLAKEVSDLSQAHNLRVLPSLIDLRKKTELVQNRAVSMDFSTIRDQFKGIIGLVAQTRQEPILKSAISGAKQIDPERSASYQLDFTDYVRSILFQFNSNMIYGVFNDQNSIKAANELKEISNLNELMPLAVVQKTENYPGYSGVTFSMPSPITASSSAEVQAIHQAYRRLKLFSALGAPYYRRLEGSVVASKELLPNAATKYGTFIAPNALLTASKWSGIKELEFQGQKIEVASTKELSNNMMLMFLERSILSMQRIPYVLYDYLKLDNNLSGQKIIFIQGNDARELLADPLPLTTNLATRDYRWSSALYSKKLDDTFAVGSGYFYKNEKRTGVEYSLLGVVTDRSESGSTYAFIKEENRNEIQNALIQEALSPMLQRRGNPVSSASSVRSMARNTSAVQGGPIGQSSNELPLAARRHGVFIGTNWILTSSKIGSLKEVEVGKEVYSITKRVDDSSSGLSLLCLDHPLLNRPYLTRKNIDLKQVTRMNISVLQGLKPNQMPVNRLNFNLKRRGFNLVWEQDALAKGLLDFIAGIGSPVLIQEEQRASSPADYAVLGVVEQNSEKDSKIILLTQERNHWIMNQMILDALSSG